MGGGLLGSSAASPLPVRPPAASLFSPGGEGRREAMERSQDLSEWAKVTGEPPFPTPVCLCVTQSVRFPSTAQGQLSELLREAGTDKLLIESVVMQYCHAKVLPRSPPRALFDLYVMLETATMLHGPAGAEESLETVDGRMMFPVADDTRADEIEIEVEVPDSLSKADEATVVTEVRKLGPNVHRLLHEKFAPAMLKEAQSAARRKAPQQPSTDMRAWLRTLGFAQVAEVFETLAAQGVDLAALREKTTADLQDLGLPNSVSYAIRQKVEDEQAEAKARADLVRDMRGAEGGDADAEDLTDDDVRRAQVLRSHFGQSLLAPGAADDSSGEEEGEDVPVNPSILYPVHRMLRTEVIGIYFGAAGRRRADDVEFEKLMSKAYAQLRAEDRKVSGGKGGNVPQQRLEVVYVSHDHSVEEFREARKGRPWLALQWADRRQKARLCHAYQVSRVSTERGRAEMLPRAVPTDSCYSFVVAGIKHASTSVARQRRQPADALRCGGLAARSSAQRLPLEGLPAPRGQLSGKGRDGCHDTVGRVACRSPLERRNLPVDMEYLSMKVVTRRWCLELITQLPLCIRKGVDKLQPHSAPSGSSLL